MCRHHKPPAPQRPPWGWAPRHAWLGTGRGWAPLACVFGFGHPQQGAQARRRRGPRPPRPGPNQGWHVRVAQHAHRRGARYNRHVARHWGVGGLLGAPRYKRGKVGVHTVVLPHAGPPGTQLGAQGAGGPHDVHPLSPPVAPARPGPKGSPMAPGRGAMPTAKPTMPWVHYLVGTAVARRALPQAATCLAPPSPRQPCSKA